jgi:cytidylate kinase
MKKKRARRPVIAIDGPAGAGKSTLAARLAKKLGYVNIESGAMYRALALKAIEEGVPSKIKRLWRHWPAPRSFDSSPAATATACGWTAATSPAASGGRT